MKKFIRYFLRGLPIIALIIFIILEIMSRSAAAIFNYAMMNQDMLRGTITVEKITATPTGIVNFNGLVWKDINDHKILDIPEGSFRVRLWDILTRHFKSTTVQELSLSDANISLDLDENMQVDFVRHSSDFDKVSQGMKSGEKDWEMKVSRINKTEEELKEIGEKRRRLQQAKIENGWQNFNTEGRKLRLKLNLKNCRFEILYRDRHCLLKGVNVEADLNTAESLDLKLRTGAFGGTMIGRGLEIRGNVDFANEIVPQCRLTVLFQDVDPSSLGFGLNIHDKMTMTAYFVGPISRPIGEGSVKMKELHIPGLDFKNVEGDIHYEDSELKFSNVTADIYGGKLKAYGDYNIDTRYYNIYGHGDKLRTALALPKDHLHCRVGLDLEIKSKGHARETYTSGSFTSGKGRYSILMFESISGKFQSSYHNLLFYDVAINFGNYKISTDALSIIDKKLHLEPINIIDNNGELIATYVHKG